ncbi:hypothetical protein [Tsuneonella dongtanensis]|nr:hypothetical protein [Tsuneonella dongtanensis]
MNGMSPDDARVGQRAEPRCETFATALMTWSWHSAAVMVCNISSRGMMIEGVTLPAPGEAVGLWKGAQCLKAQVVWREGMRAGLHLDAAIDPADWRSTSHPGQIAVDQTFRRLKRLGPFVADFAEFPDPSPIGGEILCDVARGLEELGECLAADDRVIATIAEKLQVLDIASQLLRKLAARPQIT